MKPTYEARFLSWCKSYEQEEQEMRELIESNPPDVKQLKKEYEELTGTRYKTKYISEVDESESKEQECRNRNHPNNNYSRKLKDY